MREIKFRAYLKEEFMSEMVMNDGELISKGMYSVTGLHFFEGGEITSISIDSEEYGEIQDLWLCEFHFELMQFTGLKDVNGKEIYEGDILEILDPWTKTTFNVKVWYNNGAFLIGTIMSRFRYLYEINCRNLRVIGNVYENPELLEDIT